MERRVEDDAPETAPGAQSEPRCKTAMQNDLPNDLPGHQECTEDERNERVNETSTLS